MTDTKILAVDDSPTMRRIIVNTLKRAGYTQVIEASDGRDALEKLKTCGVNLVITDWNMPQMDGLALVRILRNSNEYKQLPVLMITTRSVREDIVKALKAGVNNYIVKPFSPETLRAKIEEVLSA
jgi:two-component system chemotaxis response regulator CheY